MKLYSISIEEGAKATPIIWCPSYYPVVSPDDKYVAYVVTSEASIQIVDLSSQSLIQSWVGPLHVWFLSWSPSGRELSLGGGHGTLVGLWIYNMEAKRASKVLSGMVIRSCWSPDESRLAFALGPPFYEIWVAETAALSPGRTLKEHYQEMVDYFTRRIETDPEDPTHYLWRTEWYIYLQEYEKATADLERCAKLVESGDQTTLTSWMNRLITDLAVGGIEK